MTSCWCYRAGSGGAAGNCRRNYCYCSQHLGNTVGEVDDSDGRKLVAAGAGSLCREDFQRGSIGSWLGELMGSDRPKIGKTRGLTLQFPDVKLGHSKQTWGAGCWNGMRYC